MGKHVELIAHWARKRESRDRSPAEISIRWEMCEFEKYKQTSSPGQVGSGFAHVSRQTSHVSSSSAETASTWMSSIDVVVLGVEAALKSCLSP